jgi:hypothetical protein
LIGALIGSAVQNSQTKKLEASVSPLRSMMVGYDFVKPLMAALQARVPGSGIAARPSITISHAPWLARQDLDKMPKHALVIRPRYAIDETFGNLYVRLLVTIEDREVKNGKVKTKTSFSRPYAFHSDFAVPALGQIEPWTDLGPERLSALMDQSIDQAVSIMVHDFSAGSRPLWTDKFTGKLQLGTRKLVGHAERRDGEIVWVRSGNKRAQWLSGFQTLRSGALPIQVATTGVGAPGAGVVEDINAASSYSEGQSLVNQPQGDVPSEAVQAQGEAVVPAALPPAKQAAPAAIFSPQASPVSTAAGQRKGFWETHRPQPSATSSAGEAGAP